MYLLVCTPRTENSDAMLEDWLKLIRAFGGESPVFVVKSKCDLLELDLDENRLRDMYPNILGFYSTSAKENLGIKELKKAIEISLPHPELKHIQDLIPRNQLKVKKALLRTQRNLQLLKIPIKMN